MANGTDDLVLEHLRYIRHQVDALREDMGELKLRMSSVEGPVVSVTRVELIERRLVIAES